MGKYTIIFIVVAMIGFAVHETLFVTDSKQFYKLGQTKNNCYLARNK